MKIVFLGMPGSGKGTHAKLLSTQLHVPHLSTGDLFRQEMKQETKLGLSIVDKMDKGQLIDDTTTNQLVRKHIENQPGYILDGYPRTVAQAQYLDTYAKPDLIVYLELNREEAVNRLIERGKTSNRSDDNEKVIQDRIVEYLVKTEPLLIHYTANGKLETVKAEGAVEDIFTRLLATVKG